MLIGDLQFLTREGGFVWLKVMVVCYARCVDAGVTFSFLRTQPPVHTQSNEPFFLTTTRDTANHKQTTSASQTIISH